MRQLHVELLNYFDGAFFEHPFLAAILKKSGSRSNSPHTMPGHAALSIDTVSVREKTPHGGRRRQWSASYPGDVHNVILLIDRVVRTAFRE